MKNTATLHVLAKRVGIIKNSFQFKCCIFVKRGTQYERCITSRSESDFRLARTLHSGFAVPCHFSISMTVFFCFLDMESAGACLHVVYHRRPRKECKNYKNSLQIKNSND